nr:DNA recombination protein RmuC [Clostridia bacterium]
MTATYILIGTCAILAIVIVVLAVSLSSVRRDISAQRSEIYQTLQTEFSEMARQMEGRAADEDRRMEYLRQTMENRLNALRTENAVQMESIRSTVDEKLQNTLDERLSRSFSAVRESLDTVYKGLGEMQGLARDASDLRKILTNVKSRGVIG